MLKKSITYMDPFTEEEVTEEHYFHLSQAEIVELEMSVEGGLHASLQRIIDTRDGKEIMREFKRIILISYGKRSPDGKHFIKNDRIREEFESSEAYSSLFMELVLNADKAAEFSRGLLPANLQEEAMRLTQAELSAVPDPAPEPEKPKKITRGELINKNAEDFRSAMADIQSGKLVLVE